MADSVVTSPSCQQKTVKQNGRQQRVHYTTVNMAPCKICGGKSTGYHFGVVSCEACKAFFRRAIAKNPERKHVCDKGRACANQSGKISSCYDCRLRRCIETGMSKNAVRRGRYSMELRTKSILDASLYKNKLLYQKSDHIRDENDTNEISTKNGVTLHQPSPKPTADNGSGTRGSSTRQFPWLDKSSILKSFVDSDDKFRLTNREVSLMKALCEGCSFCRNVDCISENGEESLETSRHSSDLKAVFRRGQKPNGSMQSLQISGHSCQDTYIQHDTNDQEGSPMNIGVKNEEDRKLFDLIQTLVRLQSTLYPQYKVTEEILHKQEIIEKEHQQREEAFLFMFGTTEYASSNDFKEVLSEVNIELDDRLTRFREKARATETSIVNYIYHCKFVPGFKQLDKDDVSKLLKASYFEFWIFSNFATMNEKTGVAGGTDVVLNGHKKVITTFLPKDHVDAVFGFCLSLQKLDLSLEEVSIIRAIILTITDRCALKESHKVDSLNQMFIRCLQYHLQISTPQPNSRFYQIFDRLIAVRSLVHKNKNTNVQFLKDWGFLMVEFPLWKEMMVSQLSAQQKAEATKIE